MTPIWFNEPDRTNKLSSVAKSWIGTPWGQNSCVKGDGGGVACHLLPYGILKECGFSFPFMAPMGPAGWSNHSDESLIEKFMDDCHEFGSVEKSEMEPGDLLGFKVGRCVHHMGVYLGDNMFVHVWRNTGVIFSTLEDPTYSTRLTRVWRPLP